MSYFLCRCTFSALATGQVQISTADPDSRQLITRNNITEVAYNVQTVVDAKHNLPIDYKVTNENDSKAMGGMLRRTKVILYTTNFTALYDKLEIVGNEKRIPDSIIYINGLPVWFLNSKVLFVKKQLFIILLSN